MRLRALHQACLHPMCTAWEKASSSCMSGSTIGRNLSRSSISPAHCGNDPESPETKSQFFPSTVRFYTSLDHQVGDSAYGRMPLIYSRGIPCDDKIWVLQQAWVLQQKSMQHCLADVQQMRCRCCGMHCNAQWSTHQLAVETLRALTGTARVEAAQVPVLQQRGMQHGLQVTRTTVREAPSAGRHAALPVAVYIYVRVVLPQHGTIANPYTCMCIHLCKYVMYTRIWVCNGAMLRQHWPSSRRPCII